MMFLVLAISGNPYFGEKYDLVLITLSLIPIYFGLKNRSKKIRFVTIGIFAFMLGYELVHAVMFSLDYSKTIIAVFLKLWIAFAVVRIFNVRFIQIMVDTMVLISIISLVFTFLSYVPGVGNFFWNLAPKLFPIEPNFVGFAPRTLVVYTLSHEFFHGSISYVRNAGIFWESGAFAVFLCITLYLHYLSKKIDHINQLFDRKSSILIVTLISTTSTTGLIGLILILLVFSMRLRSKLKYAFMLIFFAGIGLTVINVSYLGDKITSQISKSGAENNRFGSALLDIEDIMRRPVLGWSRRIEVLFASETASAESHRPNGLTNFIRNYGFLYFTFYFFLVFKSFDAITKYYGTHLGNRLFLVWSGIFLLWLVSFSELIYDKLFLKSFVFIHLVYIGHHVISSSRKIEKYIDVPKKPDFKLLES